MATNIEQEIPVPHGAADAPDIEWVFLDHDDRRRLLGQAVSRGEAGGPGADHENVCICGGHVRRDPLGFRAAFAQNFVKVGLIAARRSASWSLNEASMRA